MTKTVRDEFDCREGYCRILGHHLRFSYCRTCQEGFPCFKILDCWFEKFDVLRFVKDNYTPVETERFLQPPKPKMQTLMTLIRQAQERMKEE